MLDYLLVIKHLHVVCKSILSCHQSLHVCLGTIIGKLSTFSCIDAFATNLRNDTNLNVGSPYIIPGLLKIDMVWIGDVG